MCPRRQQKNQGFPDLYPNPGRPNARPPKWPRHKGQYRGGGFSLRGPSLRGFPPHKHAKTGI